MISDTLLMRRELILDKYTLLLMLRDTLQLRLSSENEHFDHPPSKYMVWGPPEVQNQMILFIKNQHFHQKNQNVNQKMHFFDFVLFPFYDV